MQLILKKEGQEILVTRDGTEYGSLYYSIKQNNLLVYAECLECINNNSVIARFQNAEVLDEISGNGNLVKVTRHWKIFNTGKWQLLFGYSPLTKLPNWVVPAVMYDENSEGSGKFPRGGIEKGWSFREDRIPVPSCSILYDNLHWQAVFTQPARSVDDISSVKTYERKGLPAFEIRVPYTEEPYTYMEKGIMTGGLQKRTEIFLSVKKVPYEYSRTFYIIYGKYTHRSDIFISLVSNALDEFGKAGGCYQTADWSSIASLKLNHLEYLLLNNRDITAIKMGKGNGLFQSFYEYTAGSFLVRSLEGATIFARVKGKNNNSFYIDIADKIGTFFLGGCAANGMHRDCFSLKSKQWGGYMGIGVPLSLQNGVNARCNGEVMLNYLRLYRLLDSFGINREQFLRLVRQNADFYISHQLKGNEDGSFGRWWDLNGSPINSNGTNGAYIISMLVELEKTSGRRPDIDMALEKAGKYYSSLIENNSFYADTLDADCVDKEAGSALLRAFLDLYERSYNDTYLKYAKLSAGFILSWLFTYNVVFNKNSPLGKRGFRTAGMTAVSVAHHHLDFYGLHIAYDFLRLWKVTKEDIWKTCALLMLGACSQLISDRKDLLGRNRKFIGWQPEQVNQTNWDYKSHLMGTKGRFHTCIAWVAVLTLGAMLDIRERFPDILDFKF